MNVGYKSALIALTLMTIALTSQAIFLEGSLPPDEIIKTIATALLAVSLMWILDAGTDNIKG